MSLMKHIEILKREKEHIERDIKSLEEKGITNVLNYRKEFLASLDYAIRKLDKLLSSNRKKGENK